MIPQEQVFRSYNMDTSLNFPCSTCVKILVFHSMIMEGCELTETLNSPPNLLLGVCPVQLQCDGVWVD